MKNPLHNRNVRKIGGKILYGLSFFDHVSSSKKSMLISSSKQAIKMDQRLCIYVTYAESALSPTSIDLVKELTQLGFEVIHINNIDTKEKADSGPHTPTYQRKNFGYDLGAVRDGLQLLPQYPTELLVLNSSVLYFAGGLGGLLEKARSSSLDVVGITESLQTRRHIQSYFFYSKTEIGIRSLIYEYGRMRNWRTKRAAVAFGELKMMGNMISRNTQVGTLVPYHDLATAALQNPNLVDSKVLIELKMEHNLNPTQHLWMVLFYFGMPFIKKTLLQDNPARVSNKPENFTEASEVFRSVSMI